MLKWFEKHSRISWFVTLLISIAIFYISSLTFGYNAGGIGLKAVFYHLFAFFFLAFFLLISLTKGKEKRLMPIGIVVTVLYGISDEIHQFFVPGRAMTLFDIFIDTVGIVVASIIYLIVLEFRGHAS